MWFSYYYFVFRKKKKSVFPIQSLIRDNSTKGKFTQLTPQRFYTSVLARSHTWDKKRYHLKELINLNLKQHVSIALKATRNSCNISLVFWSLSSIDNYNEKRFGQNLSINTFLSSGLITTVAIFLPYFNINGDPIQGQRATQVRGLLRGIVWA